MDKKLKVIMGSGTSILCASLATLAFTTSPAHAEWNFGIGTGFSMLNIDGEQGFDTDFAGPIKYDVSLDPGDVNDLMNSAIGFAGYATDGTWLIQYSYGMLELEGDASRDVPAIASNVASTISFKMTNAEVTAGYPIYQTPDVVTLFDWGLRYTKHEFDADVSVSGARNEQHNRSFDKDWADVLLGVTVKVPFAKEWSWNSRLNAGFGGSDGTYLVSTGVVWRFHPNWTTGLNGQYKSVKYETGDQGEGEWYLYDADESSLAISIAYNW